MKTLLHRFLLATLTASGGASLLAVGGEMFRTDMTASMADMWEMKSGTGDLTGAHAGIVMTAMNSPTGMVNCGGSGRPLRDLEQGSSHYFTTPDSAALSLGSDTSFTAIAFADSENYTAASHSTMLAQASNISLNNSWAMFHTEGVGYRLTVYSSDSNSTTVTMGNPDQLLAGCVMLACYHDGPGNQIGCSINAGAFTTATHSFSPGTRDTSGAITIGGNWGGGTPLNFFDGGLGQVIFIKGAVLSGANITEIYNGGAGVDYTAISAGGGGSPNCKGSLLGVGCETTTMWKLAEILPKTIALPWNAFHQAMSH